MRNRLFFVMLFVVLTGGIFLFSLELRAEEPPSIVITEIAAYEPNGYEWIEILNSGEEPIDLAGWKFWENNRTYDLTLKQGNDTILDSGEYAIITQNDVKFFETYPNVTTTVFDSINWQTLHESGEEIGLRDADNTVIEQFIYIAAPNFSLERIHPLVKDYSSENWKEHPDSNSVGTQNFWHEETNEQEPGEEEIPEEYSSPTAIITAPTSSLISETIILDAHLSHDDGTIVDYIWDLGDTTTSSGQIISHTYSTTGTFAVFLTVTDDDGLTGAAIHEITIVASSTIPIDEPEEPIEEEVEEEITVSPGDIVINEFVSNPTSGSEWIELYNNTAQTVSLIDWTMFDGAGKLTTFNTSIPPNGMLVLELPSHKLNNTGDIIMLKNAESSIIDSVSYGIWNDGDVTDNAPTPASGRSLARSTDGEDNDDDANDFEETTTPTKGLPNIITASVVPQPTQQEQQPIQETISLPTFQKSDIVINEFVSDPVDRHDEFIELYNSTNSAINLHNWRIEDGSKTKTVLSGTVHANNFFVLEKPKGALNNAGDLIVLFDPSGNEIDRVVYGNWNAGNMELNAPAVADPMSLARRVDGHDTDNYLLDFAPTLTITKGASNIITEPNRPPIIRAIIPTSTLVSEFTTFDASQTTDPDNDDLVFVWNIGNSTITHGETVTHLFEKTGTFTITLTVTDSHGNEAVHKQKIVVTKTEDFVGGSFDRTLDGLFISEIYPNPPGADDREFIELFNASTSSIDLSGLFLDDGDGGSKPYKIPAGTTIAPGEYLELYQTETKLTLNNTSDAARILFPDLSVFSDIPYTGAKEGVSYSKHPDGNWHWSTTPTPGEENVISFPVVKTTTKTASTKPKAATKQTITATIADAKQFEKGTLVRVTGTVTSLPGVLGTQIFYIMDDTGGVQIYSYKKDFPTLAIGTQVEVSGELSEVSGEARIKTADKTAMKVIGRFPRDPIAIELEHLGEEYLGSLIIATGEATEIKSSSLYVDDGSAEGLVYIKKTTGIENMDIQPGESISVIGILSQTKTGYRILPRAPEDIQKIVTSSFTPFYQEDNTNVATKKSSSLAETYLTATAGGLTSIFFGLVAKNRGPAAANRVRQASAVAFASLRRKKK